MVNKRGPKAQNPKSRANLVSLADRPKKQRKAIARKGGRISAIKYNDNLKLQRLSKMIMNSELPEGELKNELISAGISPESATRGAGMIFRLTKKVMEKGDVEAFKALRDTAGEKPSLDITTDGEPITGIDISFVKRRVKDGKQG